METMRKNLVSTRLEEDLDSLTELCPKSSYESAHLVENVKSLLVP